MGYLRGFSNSRRISAGQTGLRFVFLRTFNATSGWLDCQKNDEQLLVYLQGWRGSAVACGGSFSLHWATFAGFPQAS
jgi:hypothetical protein